MGAWPLPASTAGGKTYAELGTKLAAAQKANDTSPTSSGPSV